jgi:hypothetical protein
MKEILDLLDLRVLDDPDGLQISGTIPIDLSTWPMDTSEHQSEVLQDPCSSFTWSDLRISFRHSRALTAFNLSCQPTKSTGLRGG